MSSTDLRDPVPADALRVAGITPFTTIDFPGRLSAVAFIQGCPWKCVYCQNAWMQPREFDPALQHASWGELEALLRRRQGLLDGVVFSGGEPTLDPALPAAVRAVREMGFQVALHTGGSYPARLKEVLPLLDWVGLDVKAVPSDTEHWTKITGTGTAAARWAESFELIRQSGVAYECRTTAHPDYMPAERLLTLARWLAEKGVQDYALQIYRRPPGLLAGFPAVDAAYPGEAVSAELRALFPRYTERRA